MHIYLCPFTVKWNDCPFMVESTFILRDLKNRENYTKGRKLSLERFEWTKNEKDQNNYLFIIFFDARMCRWLLIFTFAGRGFDNIHFLCIYISGRTAWQIAVKLAVAIILPNLKKTVIWYPVYRV